MRTVLENISFSLNEDEKLGIVGINGCGKSSLFRLILGEEECDCGEIYISKDKTVGVLRQDGAFTLPEGLSDDAKPAEVMLYSYPELLEAEARLDEMKRRLDAWSGVSDNSFYTELSQKYTDLHAKYIADGGMEFRSRCVSVLRRMGFDDEMLSRPVATLSGGQKTRLAISVQLCREPDILLLDEPTNHLDIETLGWLESYLASYKKCVLVISHDRYFLDRVTTKTLFIEHTKGKLFNGSYTPASALREDADRIAEKHYWEQQKYIKHQEEYIAQQRAWNREKNIKRAESREKMLDKLERLERPKEAPRPIHLKFSQEHSSGNDVLYVRDVGFSYPGNELFRGLDFLLQQKERLFIIGKNGCGKSTLVKLLTGQPLGKIFPRKTAAQYRSQALTDC
jgi:ATP-binding cassette subfamily F protein 3